MSKKLRILEVNKAYSPHVGGIETLVKQYCEELGKINGDEITALVCRDGMGKGYWEKVDGVNVKRAGSLGTYFSCPLSFSFIRIFRKMSRNADVVHINVPFPLADVALLLSGYKGRVVVSWHSDIVKQKKLMLFYKPFMNYLLKRADCIIVATKGHIKGSSYLKKYAYKCKVVPYGIEPENYLAISGGNFLTQKCKYKDSIKVFFTGRLVYYKGVDVLIDALCKVDAKCELFIAGEGELREELQQKVVNYGLSDLVHFLGFLPDNELKMAYADCDIFVLPSVAKSEAFGIVQLEAMVYGKPVINTSLHSGVPYVSVDGKTGITVPPNNPNELANAIATLATNPELRKYYGQNARERVEKYFNEQKNIKKLYQILKGE